MTQIIIQGNATLSWYRKSPNFENTKMILVRSFSLGISIGLLLSSILVRFVISPNSNITSYLVLSGLSALISLYAHLRMQLSGKPEKMTLTNAHSYLIDITNHQLYLHGSTGDTPIFDIAGYLFYRIVPETCQITLGGFINNGLLRVLEEEYFEQSMQNARYWDFAVTISATKKVIDELQHNLTKSTAKARCLLKNSK